MKHHLVDSNFFNVVPSTKRSRQMSKRPGSNAFTAETFVTNSQDEGASTTINNRNSSSCMDENIGARRLLKGKYQAPQ